MIKIAFKSDDDKYGISQMQTLIDFVKKYIPILKISENPDFWFVHHNQYNKVNGLKIIIERADSSTWIFSRNLIKKKDVLGVFKHTVLDKNLQNLPFCSKRYHITILNDIYKMNSKKEKLEFVNSKELKKLHCRVPIFMRWKTQEKFKISKIKNKKNKDIVSKSSLLTLPELIKHRKSSFLNKNENKINRKDWLDLLASSKVCVCPWGYGEMCYRDYEAMYSGCVVVKPYTDFVQTWPNIYKSNITYVPCKEDFSDLSDVCDQILRNYKDYEEMIENNKKILNPNFEKMEFEFIKSIKKMFII